MLRFEGFHRWLFLLLISGAAVAGSVDFEFEFEGSSTTDSDGTTTFEPTTTETPEEASTSTPAPSCQCGAGLPRLPLEGFNNLSKIVGGVSSKNSAWPWMAIIVTGHGGLCGGSLINDRFILTAAHCVDRLAANEMLRASSVVVLGRNRIFVNSTAPGRAIRRISPAPGAVAIHPLYNASGSAPVNDIALLRLASPVTFSDRIRPICLNQEGAPFVGQEALVTGWGKVNESAPTPSNGLREARVVVISNEECGAAYPGLIRGTHVCAYRPGHDACNGDSGGPLIVRKEGGGSGDASEEGEDETEYFTQIGVVSFGRGCGGVGSPGVYTRVEKYLNWIKARTKAAEWCEDSFGQ